MKSFHELTFKDKIPEVIGLKREGKSNREIAKLLHISTRDVGLILKHYSPELPLDIVYNRISKERSFIVNKPVKPPEMRENINLTDEDIKAIALKAYEMLERERQNNPTPTEKMRKDFTELSDKVRNLNYKVDKLMSDDEAIKEWAVEHDEQQDKQMSSFSNAVVVVIALFTALWALHLLGFI